MASLIERTETYYAQFYDGERNPSRYRFTLKTTRKRTARKLLVKFEDDYLEGKFDPWTDDPWSYDQEEYDAVTVHEAMDRFLSRKREDGRSNNTLRTYREIIGLLARFGLQMFGHLGLQNLVQDRLQQDRHSPVPSEQLVDLLVVDLDLNGSHRGSALVVVLTRLQPGRTRWLFLSSRVSYTIIGTQPFSSGIEYTSTEVGYQGTTSRTTYASFYFTAGIGYLLRFNRYFYLDSKISLNARLSEEEICVPDGGCFQPDSATPIGFLGLGVNF